MGGTERVEQGAKVRILLRGHGRLLVFHSLLQVEHFEHHTKLRIGPDFHPLHKTLDGSYSPMLSHSPE